MCVVHEVILTRLELSCAILDLQSHVALLGTQLLEYDGPKHHTIIWFNLSTRWNVVYPFMNLSEGYFWSVTDPWDLLLKCFILYHP